MTTPPRPPHPLAGAATADAVVEPLFDLSRVTAGVRRRRRVWATLALVGLAVGVAVGVLLPLRATATTQIYVVHADESAGTTDALMKTDLALLGTTTVASEAVQRLRLPDPPEKFVSTYSGVVVAGHILEITARGANGADAVARARAVGDAFIAVHVAQVKDATTAQVDAFTSLRDAASKQVDALDDQLAKAVPARRAALDDQRAKLLAQIASLDQQAQQASIGSPAVEAGTKVIDTARETSHSLLVTAGLYGGIGLLVGLGVGFGLAAVAAVARDRPALRRDIAAHLGASVIAQLRSPVRGPLRALRARRDAQEWRRAVTVLAHLVETDDDPVSLLEVGCPAVAAALVRDLAAELGGEDTVLVVDDLPGAPLAARSDESADGMRIVSGADYPEREAPEPTGPRLAVGSVGPGAVWTDLHRLGAETLLVVRAGSAEAAWLHTVARQLADAGIAVVGVVLIDPDPRDRTDGTLWDALHTAVRGRVAVTASPVSTTGRPALPARLPHPADPAVRPLVPVGPTASDPVNALATSGPERGRDGRSGAPHAPRPRREIARDEETTVLPVTPVAITADGTGLGAPDRPAARLRGADERSSQNGSRTRGRPRPGPARPVDGHATDKLPPVVRSTPADHVEAT